MKSSEQSSERNRRQKINKTPLDTSPSYSNKNTLTIPNDIKSKVGSTSSIESRVSQGMLDRILQNREENEETNRKRVSDAINNSQLS